MRGLKGFVRSWRHKMSIPNAPNKEYVILQNKSLILYCFLKKYNQLEILIRKIFEKNLSSFDCELIKELYFYYGGKIGTYIENETNSIKLSSITFKKQETFSSLSINQIVKICREKKCIEIFNKEIKSLKQENVNLILYDCLLKFLNMRNCLAHELEDISFKDKDLVELLPDEMLNSYMEKQFLNMNVSILDDMTKCILSNLIYMDFIISEIS